ncbi:MAG: META domain-containing protein [Gammaproteobacteria bacterium]|nr:META domain-containing protein [Gammaproteobacteria bacterium]MDH3433290.1 META domain-containing protein [Gammaproteobacteria bacterium]
MKATLGFLFFLLFLAGFALLMLQGRQMGKQSMLGGGASITATAWRPKVIAAESIPDDSGMFVQFEVDGSVKGHGGCNSFFGSLEKTESGIAIGPLGATRMACPDRVMRRETAFMNALQNTEQFEAGQNSLQLLGGGNTLLAELVKDE